MLPEPEHEPASFPQPLVGIPVSVDISNNFFRPVTGICLGRDVMLRTAMPVAAIDEHRDLRRTEDQVRRPAKIREGTGGYPVPQPCGMHEPPDQDLRLRVTAADRLHVAAACCGGSPGTFRGLPFGFGGHTAEGSTASPSARSRPRDLPCGSAAPQRHSVQDQPPPKAPPQDRRAVARWDRPGCAP